jgi:hypothetical protein
MRAVCRSRFPSTPSHSSQSYSIVSYIYPYIPFHFLLFHCRGVEIDIPGERAGAAGAGAGRVVSVVKIPCDASQPYAAVDVSVSEAGSSDQLTTLLKRSVTVLYQCYIRVLLVYISVY